MANVDFTNCRAEPNMPARKGELAGRGVRFGEFGRYAVAPVHTRFETVQWFVWDAEKDDRGSPAVIRQDATLEATIAGLV